MSIQVKRSDNFIPITIKITNKEDFEDFRRILGMAYMYEHYEAGDKKARRALVYLIEKYKEM